MSRSRTYPDQGTMPLLGFTDWVPQGDGSYKPVQRPPVQLMSITQAARALGYSRATIYRLYKEGDIAGVHLTRGKIMIDMQSALTLLDRSRTPDELWAKREKTDIRAEK